MAEGNHRSGATGAGWHAKYIHLKEDYAQLKHACRVLLRKMAKQKQADQEFYRRQHERQREYYEQKMEKMRAEFDEKLE